MKITVFRILNFDCTARRITKVYVYPGYWTNFSAIHIALIFSLVRTVSGKFANILHQRMNELSVEPNHSYMFNDKFVKNDPFDLEKKNSLFIGEKLALIIFVWIKNDTPSRRSELILKIFNYSMCFSWTSDEGIYFCNAKILILYSGQLFVSLLWDITTQRCKIPHNYCSFSSEWDSTFSADTF